MTLQIIQCCNNQPKFQIIYDEDYLGQNTFFVCDDCIETSPYQEYIVDWKEIKQ